MSKRRPVDLFVVGRGVRDGTGQMTLEAVEALKTCRVVLDLSADPDAVRAIHPNVVDLAQDYWTFDVNEDVYARIERIVLDEVRRGGPTVGHITDGHPLLFDDVSWSLVRRGRKLGLKVVALPGVSCLDTMVLELGVDLGNGTQILEATQVLHYDLALNPYLATFLFQIGSFGTNFVSATTRRNRKGRFTPLVDHLLKFFPRGHPAVLISSSGRGRPARKLRLPLHRLDGAREFIHSAEGGGLTLYLPPLPRQANPAYTRKLSDVGHLQDITELAGPRAVR